MYPLFDAAGLGFRRWRFGCNGASHSRHDRTHDGTDSQRYRCQHASDRFFDAGDWLLNRSMFLFITSRRDLLLISKSLRRRSISLRSSGECTSSNSFLVSCICVSNSSNVPWFNIKFVFIVCNDLSNATNSRYFK